MKSLKLPKGRYTVGPRKTHMDMQKKLYFRMIAIGFILLFWQLKNKEKFAIAINTKYHFLCPYKGLIIFLSVAMYQKVNNDNT